MIDYLRAKLNKSIEYYGTNSPVTLQISKELDIEISKEQRRLANEFSRKKKA